MHDMRPSVVMAPYIIDFLCLPLYPTIIHSPFNDQYLTPVMGSCGKIDSSCIRTVKSSLIRHKMHFFCVALPSSYVIHFCFVDMYAL